MEKKELIVFISFCKADTIYKDQIETKLLSLYDYYQSKGVNFKIIHMDNDCNSDWGNWMISAIDKADCVISILTDNVFDAAVEKRVLEEVIEARNKGKYRIPFIVTNRIEIPENYRANLNGTSRVDLRNDYNQANLKEAIDELCNKTRLTLDNILQGSNLNDNIMPIELSLNKDNAFFGRTKELKLIKEKFNSYNVVILSGQGGIGKTTLAKHFFFTNKDLYQNAYVIDARNGIKDAITNLKLNTILAPKKDIEARYQENLKELEKLSSKTIIIFDNCDNEIKNEEINQIMGLHCKSLITSRLKGEKSLLIKIGKMNDEDLIKLVYSKHPSIEATNNKTKDEVKTLLLSLFENAGYHTLTIEMASSIMKSGEYYIEEISNKLLEITEKCKTSHTDEKETIYERLSTLYDLGNLNDNERLIIHALTLISPEVGIRKRNLREILSLSDSNDINNLSERSFIEEESNIIKLHSLLSDVIYKKEEIKDKFNENELIIKYLIDYQTDDNDINTYLIKTKYLEYLKKKRNDFFVNSQETYVNILNKLGFCYQYLGIYQETLKNNQEALDVALALYKSTPNHYELAAAYNNIGFSYMNLGQYDEALKNMEKALQIFQTIYQDEPNNPDILNVYNNITSLYEKIGNFEEALKYQKKLLKIQEQLYKDKPNHQSMIISYNTIGNLYNSLDINDEALKYYQEALQIYQSKYKKIPNKAHFP